MNGDRLLHPFFTKTNGHVDGNGISSNDESTDGPESLDGAQDDATKVQKGKGRRKPRKSTEVTGKTQKTLQEIVNPKPSKSEARSEDEPYIPDSFSSEPIYSPRRKRRRLTPVNPVQHEKQEELSTETLHDEDAASTPLRQASPRVIVPASSPLPARVPEPAKEVPKTPPKKMLRLNASGKFSSPVSKKTTDEDPMAEPVKRRGRPRKSKESIEVKKLVVKLSYRDNAEFGHKIDRILRGEEEVAVEVLATPKKQRTPRKRHPPKPTHPFFTGKPTDKPSAPKQESPRKASAVTPGKLRRQTMGVGRLQSVPETNDIWTSALLKDRLMMKHPGAKDPGWPSREQAHVRGLGVDELHHLPEISAVDRSLKRKRKAARKPLPPEDSILDIFASKLTVEEEGELRPDGFREPHPSLKLPQRLLLSGQDIAQRVDLELNLKHLSDDVDKLTLPHESQRVHPALQKLRQHLPNAMSAFDSDRGEALSWTHKYAPAAADEVLQPAQEMNVLKRWLTSLTVTSVESMSGQEAKRPVKTDILPKRKRRRKNDDLDDFLVDSDEDVHDMEELPQLGDDGLALAGQKGTKSVVQAAGDGIKLGNAVLLSGPNGCGKTAAAFAVARELGFKVFEISPCERRSGKDVLDKVGDMTENHLVKHHGVYPGETSAAEEPSRNDEAFERDLASGRQGKMSAFFKPEVATKQPSPRKKQPKAKLKVIEELQQAIKKPPKDQQQSLILLEEVDILFKEDKDFWTTVLKLIATSKRPFIMTCNDENLVPLQAMSLHAILRFSPPPIELATDHMLLIAASEGHVLRREAVESLYRFKQSDLRAAIAELDFWCQIGVGDPKGGLSWIYQRYPPGSDLDSYGRRLRIVSNGTFQNGMGTLPDASLTEEDQVLWAWNELAIQPTTLFDWQGALPSYEASDALRAYSRFADTLSATDVYAGFDCATDLDTTQQPMTVKARSQYVEGMVLLQFDEFADYTAMRRQLAVSSLVAASQATQPYYATSTRKRIESHLASSTQTSVNHTPLTRQAFACFDAISSLSSSGAGLEESAFDGPLTPIATDLAPYVRSIVQFDRALADQREQLNGILSGDGRTTKRARTTRAARSALEGSQRASTRKERWFSKNLGYDAVLATGGETWPKLTMAFEEAGSREGTEAPPSSIESAGIQ